MPGGKSWRMRLFDSPYSQELRRGWLEAQLSARGGAQRGRVGGLGSAQWALQGAGVSFWTNSHLARTSVQRLRSPASRKGPHHWVQDSELILILVGGCFSPEAATVLQKPVG